MLVDGCDIAVQGTGLQSRQHQKHGRGTSFRKPRVSRLEVAQGEDGGKQREGALKGKVVHKTWEFPRAAESRHQEMQSSCPESLTTSKPRELPALSNSALHHRQRSHGEVTTVLQLKKRIACQICERFRCGIAVVMQLKARPGHSRKTSQSLGNLSKDQHRHIPGQTRGCEVQAGLREAGSWPQARCCFTDTACATPAQHSTSSELRGLWGLLHIAGGLPGRLFV